MCGNISRCEEIVPHIHVTLADRNFNVVGGHLVSAEVGATLELFIHIIDKKLIRKFDEKTNLKLLYID